MKITSAQFVKSVHSRADFPNDRRPEIAFLGRSNVGKSSLINSLVGRSSLARTSSTPGRTRAIHFYLINASFYFVDLPGYGYAKVPDGMRRSWKALVEAYLTNRPQIALGLSILDARHEPKPLDIQLWEWLAAAPLPYIVILTKTDKLSHHHAQRAVQHVSQNFFPTTEVIPFSSITRLGIQETWRAIREHLAKAKSLHRGE